MSRNTEQRLAEFETSALGYADRLFRVALRLARDRSRAEDLVQETYLLAWRNFHRFEPGTNLVAWLYKILLNVSHNERRRERVRLVPVDETVAESVTCDPPTRQLITKEEVRSALKRLPHEFLLPIILADVEGLSYKEIAEALQIPVGTVMSRLHRGRRLLRMELAGYARSLGFDVAQESEAEGWQN